MKRLLVLVKRWLRIGTHSHCIVCGDPLPQESGPLCQSCLAW
jgi:predicted nucleic acid-binding Zn ribbon protein